MGLSALPGETMHPLVTALCAKDAWISQLIIVRWAVGMMGIYSNDLYLKHVLEFETGPWGDGYEYVGQDHTMSIISEETYHIWLSAPIRW